MTKISCIFFDMDGVLIDSEPFWQFAEKTIFWDEWNIKLTEEDIHQSTGLKTTEVVTLHCDKYHIKDYDTEAIGHQIERKVIEQIRNSGKPKEGLIELVKYIEKMNWNRCLVTSSSPYVVENILNFLGLQDFFKSTFSAYSVAFGKPNPAIYLKAIDEMNVPIESILVLEDSINGVSAALSAGLNVWALPENEIINHPTILKASKIFSSHIGVLQELKLLQKTIL